MLNKRLSEVCSRQRPIRNPLTFVCTWKVINPPRGARHFEVKCFLIMFSGTQSATVWMGAKKAEFVIRDRLFKKN